MTHPFHLAFRVRDLDQTKRFYVETLGCRLGRAGNDWVDIDFFGSQIVAHVLADGASVMPEAAVNYIDDNAIPLPHFGAVLPMEEWQAMAARLRASRIEFLIAPHVRYEGKLNEQASMIFRDPSGNAIELKSFSDLAKLFEIDRPGRIPASFRRGETP